jgi:cell division septation protein DedD
MRVHALIGGVVIVVALALLSVPLVLAADQPGQGSSVQKEATQQNIETKAAPQKEASSHTELGPGMERPMKVPESIGREDAKSPYSERQIFDEQTLEDMRLQDEISSLGF